MSPTYATIVGIIFQLFGAGYLVFRSWRMSRSLSKFPEKVTYDSLGPQIDALTRELRSQFLQQMIGFLFVVGGSCLQLYAVLAA